MQRNSTGMHHAIQHLLNVDIFPSRRMQHAAACLQLIVDRVSAKYGVVASLFMAGPGHDGRLHVKRYVVPKPMPVISH